MKCRISRVTLAIAVALTIASAAQAGTPAVIEGVGPLKVNPIEDPELPDPLPNPELPSDPEEDPIFVPPQETFEGCLVDISITGIGEANYASELKVEKSGEVPACMDSLIAQTEATCCKFDPKVNCPPNVGPMTPPCVDKTKEMCDDCVASLIGGSFYDQQCKSFSEVPAGAKVCGNIAISYLVSPISLVWEKGHDVETDLSFSTFPLDPGKTGRTYVWKASEKAPLVVYDPEHTGKITSAFQLFGDWTFGGKKKLASLGSLSLDDVSAEISNGKWDNGYEALASLDQNKDGALSGRELQPLGLWFDKNRDGVSQEGEVKSVTETGVTKIFTTPDRHDPLSGAVHASAGFEREVDGSVIKGASVDWYAKSASSSAGLINGLMSMSKICSATSSSGDGITEMPVTTASLEEQLPKGTYGAINKESLGGFWRWKTTNSAKGAFGGFLTLREMPDGSITGHTYFPTALQDKAGKPILTISAFTLKGKKSSTGTISFSVQDENGNETVRSAAKVMSDGRLVGVSQAKLPVDGKSSLFRYEWEAEHSSNK